MKKTNRLAAFFYSKFIRPYTVDTIGKILTDEPVNQLFFDVTNSIVVNQVQGDYLEFGVYSGNSFIKIYHLFHTLWDRYQSLARLNGDEYDERFLSRMRFFAFDSFEGLPGSEFDDTPSHFMKKGTYSKSVEYFLANLEKKNVDNTKVVVVPGWFNDTLTEGIKITNNLSRASLIFIDCDLYESTVPVLSFITDLIQDGTVVIFDDYFRYKGIPTKGIQKAFHEWLENNPTIGVNELARCSANRVAFICYRRSDG